MFQIKPYTIRLEAALDGISTGRGGSANRCLHRLLYRASGGRIGGRLWGLPIVLLTTTGRNPTETIQATSWRAADHVAKHFKSLVA